MMKTVASNKHKRLWLWVASFIALVCGQASFNLCCSRGEAKELTKKDNNFENFEIRVIRPRYFSKKNKFELGTKGIVILNQTFIYTYLASANMTLHYNETLGLELSGAYGVSLDKEDKQILDTTYNIKTKIVRTKTAFSGNLLWTPIYGKYQLSSGRLIYFDTYLASGVGSTGIEYLFDHCPVNAATGNPEEKPLLKYYPSAGIGIGQRFFIDKKSSINWDLRNQMLQIAQLDGECNGNKGSINEKENHFNLTLQFGLSRFF